MKPRVAHVSPPTLPVLTTTGGALQRRIVAMAIEGVRSSDVTVYSIPGQSARDVPFRLIEVPCRLPRPWRDIEYLARIQYRLRRDKIDVLHSHAMPFAGFLIGARKILTVDFSEFGGCNRFLLRRLYRLALGRFSTIVPVSKYAHSRFEARWGEPADFAIVGNGVDIRTYAPDRALGDAERVKLGIPLDAFVLLYVGRLSYQKGVDLLLAAHHELYDRGQIEIHLVLVGPDGDFDSSLASARTRISKWDVPHQARPNVHKLGAVQDARLPALFNAASVAVLPTREDEMFGMAIVEAQSCGVPAIGSDSQGLLETVDPRSGWHFETGNVESLTLTILQAAGLKPSQLRARGVSARQFASKYSWSEIRIQYDDLYSRH